MPRAKMPADVIDLNGRHAHNRGRYEERVQNAVVDDTPLGPMPTLRLMTMADAWCAIAAMAPEGLLRQRDQAAVMEAAALYRNLQNALYLADVEGAAYIERSAADSNALRAALAKLGLSPVDAANVTVPKRKDGNVFDD